MSSTKISSKILTPLGTLLAEVEKDELVGLTFIKDGQEVEMQEHQIFEALKTQMDAYFKGELKKFDIPLNPEGTTFQKRVWAKLRNVPFGARISYMELAEIYGDKKAIRAVAAANGANPIAILVPCHRIIGSHGDLTGYAWGIERKKKLLQLEMAHTPQHDLFG